MNQEEPTEIINPKPHDEEEAKPQAGTSQQDFIKVQEFDDLTRVAIMARFRELSA